MSESFPSGPYVKTPLIVTADLSGKNGRRGKIPPIPYDENDSVMQDIQARMREKRRRNADLSRSRRGNVTNASILLKLSLRANNRALAKALEEARCEANQDKETISQLQWSLEYAQQEVRQYKQRVQELEGDGQILVDMLMQRRLSEENLQKTVSKVKQILREVTADHLISVASKLNEAASLCNRAPSIAKGSSIFARNASDSSDKGDSRDTFSVPVIDPDEPQSQPGCEWELSLARGCPAKDWCLNLAEDHTLIHLMPQKPEAMQLSAAAGRRRYHGYLDEQRHKGEAEKEENKRKGMLDELDELKAKKARLGGDIRSLQESADRTNIYNKKRVAEQPTAVTEETPETQPGTTEIPDENIGKDVTPNRFSSGGSNGRRSSSRRKSRMSSLLDPAELRRAITPSPPLAEEPSLITEEMEDILVGMDPEKTDHLEREMELTDPGDAHPTTETETDVRPSSAGGMKNPEHEREENIREREENISRNVAVEEVVTKPKGEEKKMKKRVGTKPSKSSKDLKKKVSKSLTLKKATHKTKDKRVATLDSSSVFDLSKGESFSKPRSPEVSKCDQRLQQNLSTESERSEPAEESTHKDGNDEALEPDGSDEVAMEEVDADASQRQGMDPDDRPLDVHLPKTRRKSRQYQNKIFKKLTTALSCDVVLDAGQNGTTASSRSHDRDARSCKGLGQILNESSFVAEVDMEEGSVLAKKPAFHRRMAGVKRKKKLYDPNTSLDKELTHSILTSPGKEDVPAQSKKAPVDDRQDSEATRDDGEVCRGDEHEQLVDGTPKESQAEDFLNQIDSLKYDEVPGRIRSVAGENPQEGKKKQTMGTFGVSCENLSVSDGPPAHKGAENVGDEKTTRRGTVCLKKGNMEGPKKAESGREFGEESGGDDSSTDMAGSRASKQKEGLVVRRGTICLERGGDTNVTKLVVNGCVGNKDRRQPDSEEHPDTGDIPEDVSDKLKKDRKTIRRGTVCLSKKRTPDAEEPATAVNGLEHSTEGSGSEADTGLHGSESDVNSIPDVGAKNEPRGEQAMRRGTVCLSRGDILGESESGIQENRPARREEGSVTKMQKSHQKRRGTFAVEPRELRMGDSGADDIEIEPEDKVMKEPSNGPAAGKKARKRQIKRKSEELEGGVEDTGKLSKKARRLEDGLHNGADDLNHELFDGDHKAVRVEQKIGNVKESITMSKAPSKNTSSASRFGWKGEELGGRTSKTDVGTPEENGRVSAKEGVLEDMEPVVERSQARSSSTLQKPPRKEKRTGDMELKDKYVEDVVEEGVGENSDDGAEVDELQHDQLPVQRRSKRVSERVSMGKGFPEKMGVTEVGSGRSSLNDLGEELTDDDDDDVSKVGKDTASREPSLPGMYTPGDQRESLGEEELKNVAKKAAKGRKGAKKGKRKSKKRMVVQDLDDSEDELDGGDLSACSARLIQEVQQTLEGAGKGEEKGDRKPKRRTVHFAAENQDDFADDDANNGDWEKGEEEWKPPVKVKKGRSKVKPQKKKTSSKTNKGGTTDRVQASGQPTLGGAVLDVENQDDNNGGSQENEGKEEARPAKVKKQTKPKKKKTSLKAEEGGTADRVQTSGRSSPVDEEIDPPDSGQRESVGKENAPRLNEGQDAQITQPEEEIPEETQQRRPSRQARVKAVKNLKEPSLGKKLRRGDPFTDAELYISPAMTKKPKKGKASKKKSTTKTALGDATNVT